MADAVALIRSHQQAQIRNGVFAATLVTQLAAEFKAGRLTREEFVASLVASDLLSHRSAVQLAVRFVQQHRELAGAEGELVEATFDGGASFGRAVGTLTDLDEARTRIDSDRDWDAEFQRIIQRLAVRADRSAKASGRDTIVGSAEASSRGWRRVSDGNPCAFCAMLVGRGPVYTSAEAAGEVVGRQRRHKRAGVREGRGRTRGTQGLGRKYHDHCGCTVVEQIGPWTPGRDEQRLVELYDRAAAQCDADGVPRTAENILGRMREGGQGVINDARAPETQAGSAGGGSNTPPRGRTPTPSDGDWSAWRKRQDALGIETHGEVLQSHEIEFCERFIALGHLPEWIPRNQHNADGGLLPTNDFIWIDRGRVLSELKSTAAKYQSIKNQIHDAVLKASAQGVIKERFIIDLGTRRLSPQLREQLSRYNQRTTSTPIKELWVMSNDGKSLEQIALK